MAALKGQPQPKPSQLPISPEKATKSPVDDFFADYSPPESVEVRQPTAGAPGDEAYSQVEAPPEEAPQEPGIGMQALDAAGRVLDYPGGFTRAGLAEVAGGVTGKGSIVTPEDLKQAAVGKGPNSAEYLRRLGVGEGGSFKIGDTKITQRGAAGLALDIATDPLTALAKMVKTIPYLAKIVNTPGKAAEALGEATYRSAFKGVDEALAAKGKAPISEAMIEAGAPVGTLNQIAEKADALSSTMGKLRQGLYDRATELGAHIKTEFPLKRAEAVLTAMNKDPGLRPAAQELSELLNRYKSAGAVTLDEMSQWKTNLYDSLPANAFSGQGKLKTQAKQFKAALAADFRDAIVQAGNKAEKGLGDSINALNERWGTLLSAENPLAKAANRGSGKLGQAIDGAVLGTAGVSGAVKKKAYELATSPAVKTVVGKALMEAGKSDFANRLTRQVIAETTRQASAVPGTEEE